jgi:hypothetical protein
LPTGMIDLRPVVEYGAPDTTVAATMSFAPSTEIAIVAAVPVVNPVSISR